MAHWKILYAPVTYLIGHLVLRGLIIHSRMKHTQWSAPMTKFYVICRAVWGNFSIGKPSAIASQRAIIGQEALWQFAAFYPSTAR
jgi:hypothetical protein